MKEIIKSCLLSVIAACKRYNVPFNALLAEIANDQLRKESHEGKRS